MSRRGLVAALLCGLIGLGLGAVVAYAAQPATTDGGTPQPMAAVSPEPPDRRPDSGALPPRHPLPAAPARARRCRSSTRSPTTSPSGPTTCPRGGRRTGSARSAARPVTSSTSRWATGPIDKADEIRFRPADEPTIGGYSLRVRILDNTFVDVHQTVATKIVGFRDSSEVAGFHIIDRTQRSVYFDYRDKTSDYHRFNFFQWFAVPGQTNATLEMSVSGRKVDVPGLKALFDRFADNVVGHAGARRRTVSPGQRPPRARTEPRTSCAVRSSSLRIWTHSRVPAFTWTARSTMTVPPGQPVEVTVSDGSAPGAFRFGMPGVVQSGWCGSVVGSRSSGSSPTKTPCPDVCQPSRSPTDSADSLNVECGGHPPGAGHLARPRARHGHRQDSVVVGEPSPCHECCATR